MWGEWHSNRMRSHTSIVYSPAVGGERGKEDSFRVSKGNKANPTPSIWKWLGDLPQGPRVWPDQLRRCEPMGNVESMETTAAQIRVDRAVAEALNNSGGTRRPRWDRGSADTCLAFSPNAFGDGHAVVPCRGVGELLTGARFD